MPVVEHVGVGHADGVVELEQLAVHLDGLLGTALVDVDALGRLQVTVQDGHSSPHCWRVVPVALCFGGLHFFYKDCGYMVPLWYCGTLTGAYTCK